MQYSYIVIEGNIGAGKTSLATRLAGEMNARLILEQFEENSFLPRFYEDAERYAFPLELSFLADRYQQLKDHFSRTDLFQPVTISDYFLHKSLIFASRNLGGLEFSLYSRLFSIVSAAVPKPDLVLFLYQQVDNLRNNIARRGRSYEQNITTDYLEKIQQGYLDFLRRQEGMRIVMVETARLDFVNHEEDYPYLKDLVGREYPQGVSVIDR